MSTGRPRRDAYADPGSDPAPEWRQPTALTGLHYTGATPAPLPVTQHPDTPLPRRAHPADAGLDLHAAVDIHLPVGAHRMVPTGTRMALAPGTVGLVCPRSGLAARHGVTVLNAPGVVDAGYRGEVKVLLVNLGSEPHRVQAGDRVAQLVIVPMLAPPVSVVDTLPGGDRGAAGFGSTGR